ncbi:epithelial splicing regulatory protein 1-like isoform X2 [Rhopilema esculentum]|uniref:epithelial splicing regulatory protein 1-like isoform X2 n=1 Tax=Rhopilema esculentum TaxID=499914 RepID=UPI0031CFDAB8
MPIPDYFVALHLTVNGKNDEMLGTDESELSTMEIVVIDSELKKVLQSDKMTIRPETALAKDEKRQPTKNSFTGSGKLMSFKESVEQIGLTIATYTDKGSKTISLTACDNLQFRQCLHPQAIRNGIKLSMELHKYHNVCHEYTKCSGKSFTSLKQIAEDAGLDYDLIVKDGKSRLCSEIVIDLINKEHSFDDPEVIMNILPPGMSTGHVLDETVVRVRGLPWQVSDHDVASFFKGLNITRGGVALCLNLKGRRNGEALVRFETAEHRDLAMKRHKHHLSGRYIEVYKGNRQDFIKIARGPVGAMNVAASFLSLGGDVIIRMRGLPYTATAKDIVAFFGKDLSIQNGESGVLLVDHPDGTSTGDAFVIFSDENDAKVALKKHRGKIGQRYVELFRSTQAELQQVLTMYNVGYQFVSPVGLVSPLMPPLSPLPGTFSFGLLDRGGANQRAQSLMTMSCLRLRGLPFSATKDDIVTFLGHHSQGVIGTVHIIYNLQGRPSGESFVQLKSAESAHKAANELHLKHMGERYIEVFQCSIHDMSLMLATSQANQMAAQHLNRVNNNNTCTSNGVSTNNNNNNSNNFIPTSPLPIQQGHRLLSPTGSNSMVLPIIPAIPTVVNGHYPHLSPTVPHGEFFQAHPFPYVSPMIPHENMNFSTSPYCKPTGMTYSLNYQIPEDRHKIYQEKEKESSNSRSVEKICKPSRKKETCWKKEK